MCTYGYRISEDITLVIDEKEAAVIRRIFDMFLHGVRVRTIKGTLNSENVLIHCPSTRKLLVHFSKVGRPKAGTHIETPL